MQVTFDPSNFKQAYFDEYTGEPLPDHLVRTAIAEERSYFNSMVWEAAKTDSAKTDQLLPVNPHQVGHLQ